MALSEENTKTLERALEIRSLLLRKDELERSFDINKDLSGGLSQAELDEYSRICLALGAET